MANIIITGMLYDKIARTTQNVSLIGEAFLSDLHIGCGPILPPVLPPGPVDPGFGRPTPPDMIWGGRPGPGGGGSWVPPGIWGGPIDPYPSHPIYYPPPNQPVPPEVPPPGGPTTPVPPPPGSAGWPVQPIVPPPYIVVQYPGVGPCFVPAPAPHELGATPPAPEPAKS